MKVGILTFHDGINYGAFFQVYALQSFLQKHGFQCQVINYKNLGFTLREYKCFLGPWQLLNMSAISNIVKIVKFKKAQKKLDLTNRFFKEKKLENLHFDAVIFGSDEIWNFGTDLIGYDPVYFSQGIDAGRFISYAASFGNITTSKTVPENLKKNLEKIEFVSVRDDNSASIMRAISEKSVQIVLDPTFLFDLRSEAIIPRECGFILVYGYFDKEMVHRIIEYSHSVGKKTISVGYNLSWCDISLNTLDPFQWLGYFAKCDCVITTMYHGMIFSILNQKEFFMFDTPYRKHKVGNLLSDLELSNHFVDGNRSVKDVFSDEIDYSKVNRLIEAKRRQSENFLLESLNF